MHDVGAVAFDLFNTLITVDMPSRWSSIDRMMDSLREQGVGAHADDFMPVYRDAVRGFIGEAERLGRETHNGVWISTALQRLGIDMAPDDPRVERAVEAYFSAFVDNARELPGTTGHAGGAAAAVPPRRPVQPDARSGGAPHSSSTWSWRRISRSSWSPGTWVTASRTRQVFQSLAQALDLPPSAIAFVGDDPRTDVQGAFDAGMRPVQTVYAQRLKDAAALKTPPSDLGVPTISSWQDLLGLLAVN